MEGYRIANFILQLVYLLAHIAFSTKIVKAKRDTPVWTWFFHFSVSMWLWVSGRFAESVVYLFFPGNNDAYVFVANYQYIGITSAAVTYLIWSLYLAGHDRLAGNKLMQGALWLYPVSVTLLVFTNPWHQLIYTKLVMGEQVAHGPLFGASMFTGYFLMLVGYIISMIDIIRRREQVVRKLLLFSSFPFLPAIAIAIRSFSGIDRFDYTPLVMGAAFVCLYLVVFRYNDAGIIPASMKEVVEQTQHPIWIYDPVKKRCSYQNHSAARQYALAAERPLEPVSHTGDFETGALRVSVIPLPETEELLVTATDMAELYEQIKQLESTIVELEKVSLALDEENRNIDAYLGSLQNGSLPERQNAMLEQVYGRITAAFSQLRINLQKALDAPEDSEALLSENMSIAEQCMVHIRAAVAQLREGQIWIS